jgi:hypothetical protein
MEEFEDVLIAILNTYPQHRWPGDIILRVFLAIEQNPAYRKRYDEFADGDAAATNPWIGKKVRELTGMKRGKEVDARDSGLIKTYSQLL